MQTMVRMTAIITLAMFIGDAAMAADPVKADPIKFGVVNEITGVQAQAGEFTVNGIKLAQPDTSLTHVNNRWVFRARPNDSYSSRVIADFGVNSLKRKKWAIIHSTDAFGSGGAKALTAALAAQGVTPVLDQGYTNNSQDFAAVVLSIKKSDADNLAIKGYKGLEGTYEFDQNGDGLHGYSIVKNEGGKIVFMKRVDFPVQ